MADDYDYRTHSKKGPDGEVFVKISHEKDQQVWAMLEQVREYSKREGDDLKKALIEGRTLGKTNPTVEALKKLYSAESLKAMLESTKEADAAREAADKSAPRKGR